MERQYFQPPWLNVPSRFHFPYLLPRNAPRQHFRPKKTSRQNITMMKLSSCQSRTWRRGLVVGYHLKEMGGVIPPSSFWYTCRYQISPETILALNQGDMCSLSTTCGAWIYSRNNSLNKSTLPRQMHSVCRQAFQRQTLRRSNPLLDRHPSTNTRPNWY